MTDYVGSQQSIAFDYDATLEVVTKDRQKLQLASSGMVSLARPDKIRTTRSGRFVDIETVFDGKTLTLFGETGTSTRGSKVPGSLDNLVDELQKKYDRPLPAADLFLTHAYDEITADVTDDKDLGGGVVGGIECDYFAFRAKGVDWQIWVAQGADRVRAGTSSRPPASPTGRSTPSSFGTGRPVARSPRRTSRSSHRRVRSRLASTAQEGEGHGRVTQPFHPRRQVMSTPRTLRVLLLFVMVPLGAIELGDPISIPILAGLATRVQAEVRGALSPVSVSGVAPSHGAPQLI